ncbi:MAG TPA: sugar ABC transporter permease, partial [Roseiflexaceae bacterium]|nr:sugar ABC transporter permease [Roseiflexaceae bacterium]
MAVQQQIDQVGAVPLGKPKLGKRARREELEFYLFISLWVIGFLAFDAGPIVASLLISFTNWTALSPPEFVAMANYQRMIGDPLFYTALRNSIYFGVGSVGLGLIVSFLLALLLNQNVKGMGIWRVLY